MPGRALKVLGGGQGTGRSADLLAAMLEASRQAPTRQAILVDPMSAYRHPGRCPFEGRLSVLRGSLARGSEAFDVLIVMAQLHHGLVVGVDDAEHACTMRSRWSSLAAALAGNGGVLLAMMPDLGASGPGFPGHARRHAPVIPFPGGQLVASLAAAFP